jgi:hypothetical protein
MAAHTSKRVLLIDGLSSVEGWYAECLLGQGHPLAPVSNAAPHPAVVAAWTPLAVETVRVEFSLEANAFASADGLVASLASGAYAAVVLADLSWPRAAEWVEVREPPCCKFALLSSRVILLNRASFNPLKTL